MPDRTTRRTLLAGLGTAAAAGLAGCGGGGGGGGGDGSGGGGSGPQDLDFWLFGGIPAERQYISNKYQEYEANDVTYEHKSWGNKYQIIASAAANQNLPDVMAGQTQQIPDYVGAGAIQPVDQDPYQDLLSELNEPFIDANVQTQMYEGLGDYSGERQWGLPGGYADLGPFIDIRTDYLEQTSFDRPPRTWPELIQMGEEMQDIDGVTAPITAPGTNFGLTSSYFIGFVYANGGRYFDPDGLTATIDQPGFVDAVRLYQDIAGAGLFPSSIAENNHIAAGRLLRQGQSGIFITLSHANAIYQTTGAPQEWLNGEGHVVTRAPLPDEPSGQFEPQDLLMQNAQGFMLGNGTANDAERDAAFDFIEWFNQPEQLAPWTYKQDIGIRGRVPTLRSAFEEPADLFRSQFGDLLTLYDDDSLFTTSHRFPSFSGLEAVHNVLNTEILQPVMLGDKTAEEACADAQPQMQQVIDENLG
ncbi:ABC transporter substrate-binding protein [Halarchaeum nitratireducens]|nr:extracellular solute-binding protein [Halarchaeum nitratireducens]